MFGPVRAQADLELAIVFRPGACPDRVTARHELLALAVITGRVGAHSDNKLAEGAGGGEEERRRRCELHLC